MTLNELLRERKKVTWLEKQNKATQAYLGKQAVWHTWEVVTVALCGVLVGVAMGKLCMFVM